MDPQLRPRFFDADPNSADAAKRWNHWFRTFETYLKTVESFKPDKLETLIHFVDPLVYDHIADHTDWESAIDTLRKLYNPEQRVDPTTAAVKSIQACYFCGYNTHPRPKCPAREAVCNLCVEEVDLLNCNPRYAHIAHRGGRVETESLRRLASAVQNTTDDVVNLLESNGETERQDMTETTGLQPDSSEPSEPSSVPSSEDQPSYPEILEQQHSSLQFEEQRSLTRYIIPYLRPHICVHSNSAGGQWSTYARFASRSKVQGNSTNCQTSEENSRCLLSSVEPWIVNVKPSTSSEIRECLSFPRLNRTTSLDDFPSKLFKDGGGIPHGYRLRLGTAKAKKPTPHAILRKIGLLASPASNRPMIGRKPDPTANLCPGSGECRLPMAHPARSLSLAHRHSGVRPPPDPEADTVATKNDIDIDQQPSRKPTDTQQESRCSDIRYFTLLLGFWSSTVIVLLFKCGGTGNIPANVRPSITHKTQNRIPSAVVWSHRLACCLQRDGNICLPASGSPRQFFELLVCDQVGVDLSTKFSKWLADVSSSCEETSAVRRWLSTSCLPAWLVEWPCFREFIDTFVVFVALPFAFLRVDWLSRCLLFIVVSVPVATGLLDLLCVVVRFFGSDWLTALPCFFHCIGRHPCILSTSMVTKRLQVICQALRTDQKPPDPQIINSLESPLFGHYQIFKVRRSLHLATFNLLTLKRVKKPFLLSHWIRLEIMRAVSEKREFKMQAHSDINKDKLCECVSVVSFLLRLARGPDISVVPGDLNAKLGKLSALGGRNGLKPKHMENIERLLRLYTNHGRFFCSKTSGVSGDDSLFPFQDRVGCGKIAQQLRDSAAHLGPTTPAKPVSEFYDYIGSFKRQRVACSEFSPSQFSKDGGEVLSRRLSDLFLDNWDRETNLDNFGEPVIVLIFEIVFVVSVITTEGGSQFMRFARLSNVLVLPYLIRPPLVHRVLALRNPISGISKSRSPHPLAGIAGLHTYSNGAQTNITGADIATSIVHYQSDLLKRGLRYETVQKPKYVNATTTRHCNTQFDGIITNIIFSLLTVPLHPLASLLSTTDEFFTYALPPPKQLHSNLLKLSREFYHLVGLAVFGPLKDNHFLACLRKALRVLMVAFTESGTSCDYGTLANIEIGDFKCYRRLRGDLILTYALFEQGLANKIFNAYPANTRRGHGERQLLNDKNKTDRGTWAKASILCIMFRATSDAVAIEYSQQKDAMTVNSPVSSVGATEEVTLDCAVFDVTAFESDNGFSLPDCHISAHCSVPTSRISHAFIQTVPSCPYLWYSTNQLRTLVWRTASGHSNLSMKVSSHKTWKKHQRETGKLEIIKPMAWEGCLAVQGVRNIGAVERADLLNGHRLRYWVTSKPVGSMLIEASSGRYNLNVAGKYTMERKAQPKRHAYYAKCHRSYGNRNERGQWALATRRLGRGAPLAVAYPETDRRVAEMGTEPLKRSPVHGSISSPQAVRTVRVHLPGHRIFKRDPKSRRFHSCALRTHSVPLLSRQLLSFSLWYVEAIFELLTPLKNLIIASLIVTVQRKAYILPACLAYEHLHVARGPHKSLRI
ncbi:hypothetical protein CLF_101409 [Clonorchis sinensis]|uniref:Uncharacterized protein n=1 Tax=Clonorchis sinensis TaxID=79923 RepID=G7Y5P3_CLOSI|nr:hypothetical protein CLF_101409 [Clonorchis sinensis]